MKRMQKKLIGILILALLLTQTPFSLVPVFAAAEEEKGKEGTEPYLNYRELQIIRRAQQIYAEVMEPYVSTDNYIYALREERQSYLRTLNQAKFYNSAYNRICGLSAAGINMLIAGLKGDLEEYIGIMSEQLVDEAVDEVFEKLPDMSGREFIYSQAWQGDKMIETQKLQRLMNRTEKNGGQFRSVGDAVEFIIAYETNRMGFAALSMGKSYYMEQLRKPWWETAIEIGGKVAISQLLGTAKMDWFDSYGVGKLTDQYVGFMNTLVAQFADPYISAWWNETYSILMELQKYLYPEEPEGNPYLPEKGRLVWVDAYRFRVGIPASISKTYEADVNSFEFTENLRFFDAGTIGTEEQWSSLRFMLCLCQYGSDVYDRQSYDVLGDVTIDGTKYTFLLDYMTENELEQRTVRHQVDQMLANLQWTVENVSYVPRTADSWREVYREFVTGGYFLMHDSFGDRIDYGSDTDYLLKLSDLDGDGIPELLIENGYFGRALRCAYVYTCDKGTLRFLGAGPCNGYTAEGVTGLLGCYSDSFTYESWTLYTKQGNKFLTDRICEIERDPSGSETVTPYTDREELIAIATEGSASFVPTKAWESVKADGFDQFLASYGY